MPALGKSPASLAAGPPRGTQGEDYGGRGKKSIWRGRSSLLTASDPSELAQHRDVDAGDPHPGEPLAQGEHLFFFPVDQEDPAQV